MHKRVRETHKKKNRCYIGVSICSEWFSYDTFLVDMGPRPEGLTLDRVDSDKGYSKGNCRWATWEEQNRHRKNNVYIDGKLLVEHWGERTNDIGYVPFYNRVITRGWDVDRAKSEPVRTKHKKELLRDDLHHSVVGCMAGAV